ncbi:MAG: DNA adenine methylase [Candidatus Marsarchaeota archaeon]|nr:DNA adenine methylase [Candidatus Marsarchaeota archaeon]
MSAESADVIRNLASEFEDFLRMDNGSEDEFNVAERTRKSVFRWSGQFTPELAGMLLGTYAKSNIAVLDPFCGSGTVLFEAAKRSLQCTGTDINPMAVEISRAAEFCNMSDAARAKYFDNAEEMFSNAVMGFGESGMSQRKLSAKDYASIGGIIAAANPVLMRSILINVLMRLSSSKDSGTVDGLRSAFETHKNLIMQLPHSNAKCSVLLADARNIPLQSSSADLILTSPPYPGVFEYSKNYKKATHLAGWRISDIARSEIGRIKGRGGRQAAIVTYANDMIKALLEMRRVLKVSGRLILIAGREIGLGQGNLRLSALLYALASGACGFKLEAMQQRQYTGRTGKRVTEDIMHLLPGAAPHNPEGNFAEEAALLLYKHAQQTEQ